MQKMMKQFGGGGKGGKGKKMMKRLAGMNFDKMPPM
jgi:hypothetical protein